jgi:glycerol-3-phosphate dehydrogenase (NAD(P)+)
MAWADVAAELGGVAEGETTVTGALALAARHGVEMPIAEQVEAVIHHGRAPLEAVATLMARTQKDELTGRDA